MRIEWSAVAAWAASHNVTHADAELHVRALQILDAIAAHAGRPRMLSLKGGAAGNLFLDEAPRLSRDLDFNALEPRDGPWAATGIEELTSLFRTIAASVGANLQVPSTHRHLLCTFTFEFQGHFGGARTKVPVEVSTGFRSPIFPPTARDSVTVGGVRARGVPVADIHEVLAGKVNATLERDEPRDLFDVVRLRAHADVDAQRLHLAVVILSATTHHLDIRLLQGWCAKVSAGQLAAWADDFLLPGVRPATESVSDWSRRTLQAAEDVVRAALALTDRDRRFVAAILDEGRVDGSLLTDDAELAARVDAHPLLIWRAQNVRKHRGMSRD